MLFRLQPSRFAFKRGDVGFQHVRDLQVRLARDLHVAVFGADDRRFVHPHLAREDGLIHSGALPQLRDHVADVPIDVHSHQKRGLGNL